MIAVISRVTDASVSVAGETIASIGSGLLALIGVGHEDLIADGSRAGEPLPESVDLMVRKVADLRILANEKSLSETGQSVLVVSQFTLQGETRRGRRPSWFAAAPAEKAVCVLTAVVNGLRERGINVVTGEFGAEMMVASTNSGPFTVLVRTP